MAEKELLCPSAHAEPGAILVGVIGTDGTVAYVRPLLQVDADFVRRASSGRAPEERFRFAQPCVEGACGHWTGSRCGVVDETLEMRAAGTLPGDAGELPRCSIRAHCRWFEQQGASACGVCPFVVTAVMPDGVEAREARVPAGVQLG